MRLGFVFSEIAQGLRRNVSMVISVILVTFVSLTFVGTASLLQLQIGQMVNNMFHNQSNSNEIDAEISNLED